MRLNTNAVTVDDGSSMLAPEEIQVCDAVITLLINWVLKKGLKDVKVKSGEDEKFKAVRAFYDFTKALRNPICPRRRSVTSRVAMKMTLPDNGKIACENVSSVSPSSLTVYLLPLFFSVVMKMALRVCV